MRKNTKIIIRNSLLVLMLVLIVLIIIIINTHKAVENEKLDTELRQNAIQEYYSDKIMPQGVSTLYGKYKGNNEKNDLYRSISKMINYLPKLLQETQKLNEQEFNQYFADNVENIKGSFGIVEIEDFVELVSYFRTFDTIPSEYKYCAIAPESYEDNNGYLIFDLNIVFENIENIKVKVYFANSKSTQPMVKFLSK